MIYNYNELVTFISNALARYDATIVGQIPNFINLAELKLARMPKNLGYKKVVSYTLSKNVAVYAKPNRWRETVSMNYGTGLSANPIARQSVSGLRTLFFEEPHDFQVSDVINVYNIGGTGYNGTSLSVSGVSSLSISYTNGSATESKTADTSGFVTKIQNSVNKILPRGYEMIREYWPDDTLTDLPEYYGDYDYDHWIIAPTPSQNYPFEVIYYEQPMPLSVSNQQNWFTEYASDALYYGALIEASAYLKNDDRIPVWQGMYNQAVSAIDGEANARVNDASTMRDKGV